MGVRHQHEIDRGQVADFQPRVADALDDLEPFGPVRVHEQVRSGRLDEKGSVADPSQPDLPCLERGKTRGDFFARTAREKGWNQDFGKEIALVPVARRLQPHLLGSGGDFPGGFFGALFSRLTAVFRRLIHEERAL